MYRYTEKQQKLRSDLIKEISEILKNDLTKDQQIVYKYIIKDLSVEFLILYKKQLKKLKDLKVSN